MWSTYQSPGGRGRSVGAMSEILPGNISTKCRLKDERWLVGVVVRVRLRKTVTTPGAVKGRAIKRMLAKAKRTGARELNFTFAEARLRPTLYFRVLGVTRYSCGNEAGSSRRSVN